TVFFCSLNIPLYHRDPAYHFPCPHRRITPFQTDPPDSISIRHKTNKQWRTDTAISTHMQTPTYRYSDEHTLANPHATVYPIPEKEAQLQRTHLSHTTFRQSSTKTPTIIPHKIPHKGEKSMQKKENDLFEDIYEQNKKRIHYQIHKLGIQDTHHEFYTEGI